MMSGKSNVKRIRRGAMKRRECKREKGRGEKELGGLLEGKDQEGIR